MSQSTTQTNYQVVAKLHVVLCPFLFRRVKDDVEQIQLILIQKNLQLRLEEQGRCLKMMFEKQQESGIDNPIYTVNCRNRKQPRPGWTKNNTSAALEEVKLNKATVTMIFALKRLFSGDRFSSLQALQSYMQQKKETQTEYELQQQKGSEITPSTCIHYRADSWTVHQISVGRQIVGKAISWQTQRM
ncbi:hypothetical protein ACET3Z_005459 [Daucus carota]